jgi:MFS family permease
VRRLSRYSELFRTPHTRSLAAVVWVASLPSGLYTVTLLLLIGEYTGSLAYAGLVAGAFGAGMALGGPPQGRLIDRYGPRAVLAIGAAVHTLSLAVLLAAVVPDGSTGAVPAAASFLAGAALPRVASVGRSTWPSILSSRPQLLGTAYAVDAFSIEALYIVGPLIASVFAAFGATAYLLGGAALTIPFGTAAFLALQPIRRWSLTSHRRGLFGRPLTSPGVRLLLVSSFAIGIFFGAVEVALLSFAADRGHASSGAILITGLSIGSASAAFAYGAVSSRWPVRDVYRALFSVAPFAACVLLAGWSIPSMFVLALPAGALLAPLFATEAQIMSEVAPAGTTTEAFTWMGSAIFAGISTGTIGAGYVVEGLAWQGAVGVGALVLAAAALAVRRFFGQLTPSAL